MLICSPAYIVFIADQGEDNWLYWRMQTGTVSFQQVFRLSEK